VYPPSDAIRAGCPVDTDGDGVPDYEDRCPDTPRGAPVDAGGCPRDGDGDGVPDFRDRCPDTPRGVQVDANGCPVDSDHDGVPDYRDRCPDTPAGSPVDADGCPVERDSDGDGVPDSRDSCPGTPRGTSVDASGCPLYDLPSVGVARVVSVAFRAVRGAPRLTTVAQAELDRVAVAMKLTADSRWEIGAYTSSVGTATSNLRLSRQRADVVREYLVARGVPAASLTAVGYGSQHPIASNRTAAGRRQNMRIEIKRLQ
jgi:OOP family OmpA-OmpF porin